MAFDIRWSLFSVEIVLTVFTVLALIVDIFLPEDEKRGVFLARLGMAATVSALAALWFTRQNLGLTLGGSYSQDGVAVFFKGLFLLAGFFTIFMASEYQKKLKRGHGEFILLILFSQIGACFLVSANDLLLFFVALETFTVSLYILTAYLRDKSVSIEAGVKYLVLGALSTAVFLYGLSFIYGATGSTAYGEMERRLALMDRLPLSFLFGMILVVSSLGFKIAAAPFQLWVPDIYEGAPTPVTAYLAIGSKAVGFAALLKLMLTIFAPAADKLIPLLGVLAGLTVLYGNLGAIPQTNLKRLLGYSSIGHAGYLLIGLASFAHSGKEAVLVYLASYLVSTAGAFLVIVAVSPYTKSDEMGELAGLSRKSPLLAAGMLLSLLSLAGVPPLAGFFAKFYILWASVKAGLLWLTVIGVLNVVTSLYYYLKVVKVLYIDPPLTDAPVSVSAAQKAVQYFSIFGIVLLGLWPGPIVRIAEQAFSGFLR